MVLATVKRLSTLLTSVEQTFSREICRLFHIANPIVTSHHIHCPLMVAQECTVLGQGAASGQIKGAAVIIGAVRCSAARGEVLHKFGRRKEAGVHEECACFDICIRGEEHDELGHVSNRRIGEQRPHEEVGLSEAWILLMEESVVKFENYSGKIRLEE
jgi:hypothetical protein